MSRRYFGLIPAAGHSTRMQQPKLLLPLNGQPLILHTIAAWQRSEVDRIIVVVRPGDDALAKNVHTAGVDLVIPQSPPPDMKASLLAALEHIEQRFHPTPDDAFLVAPADMPRLSAPIIDRLIERHRSSLAGGILVPSLNGRRGHPVLFSWPMAMEVHRLSAQEGLDAIVHRHSRVLVPCEDLIVDNEYPFADIDTPEDYHRMTDK